MIQVTRLKPEIAPDRDPPFLDIVYMFKDPDGPYVAYEDYVKLYNECVELESRLRDQDNEVYGDPYERLARLREALSKKNIKLTAVGDEE